MTDLADFIALSLLPISWAPHIADRLRAGEPLRGILIYDFAAGTVRTLRCAGRTVELSAA